MERGLAAYSCGGSQGMGPFTRKASLTLFPLASLGRGRSPRLGNHQAARIIGRGRKVSNRRQRQSAVRPRARPGNRCNFDGDFYRIGRSERIRTSDPLVPNEVRYQTAPHSVSNPRRRYSLRAVAPQGPKGRRIWRIPARLHPQPDAAIFRAVSQGGYALSAPAGASPSGKATDFDSVIRRFESSRPSQSYPLNQLRIFRRFRLCRTDLCHRPHRSRFNGGALASY